MTSTDPTKHCFREDNCAEHSAHEGSDCCCCGRLAGEHGGCDCEQVNPCATCACCGADVTGGMCCPLPPGSPWGTKCADHGDLAAGTRQMSSPARRIRVEAFATSTSERYLCSSRERYTPGAHINVSFDLHDHHAALEALDSVVADVKAQIAEVPQ